MQDQSNKNNKVIQNNSNIKTPKIDLLDGDLVSLINSLIKALKEYYQVSSNNCSDANQIVLYYKEDHQNLQILLNDIIINNRFEKINEVFEKINSLGEIISQLQENSNSFLQNLNLFFEDAKIIFKNIHTKRQKQLIEHNKNKNLSRINDFKKNLIPLNFKPEVNRLYDQIINKMNKLSDFDYIIEKTDSDSATYFNNLKNTIKNNLGELINYIMQFIDKNNGQNKQYLTLDEDTKRTRNKSNYYLRKDIEKFKITEKIKDKKIEDLTETIRKMKKKYYSNADLEGFYNLENSNKKDIKSFLSEKNNIISILQKQIKVYEQNETILNKQLDDLNNQFHGKINQYENQIRNLKLKLSTNINNNKNELLLNSYNNANIKNKYNIYSQTEMDLNVISQNNFEKMKNKYNSNMNILKNKNLNLMKQIKAQKIVIDNLNKEIENYKNKLDEIDKINKYQIEEMNNNIYKNNKIIEQKDELIKQLREKKEIPNAQININMGNKTNNNQILLLKLENEKLKNEISSLKGDNNISSLKTKNSELEENIIILNKKIKNLELEISKKNEQIEGMHDFIAKLQSKIENNDFNIQKRNSKKISKSEYEINNNSSTDISEKWKNLLDLLNKANQDIATLQKKNKELQFKLEDKELEEELSGFRTEEVNFSNYEEEFDLKKIINGAKIKNKSEDIYIDYPGIQSVKNKYKALQIRMGLLEDQIKILLSNINCNNNKIKPQVNQICQLMRIPAKNIQLIIAGKNKKKIFGLED